MKGLIVIFLCSPFSLGFYSPPAALFRPSQAGFRGDSTCIGSVVKNDHISHVAAGIGFSVLLIAQPSTAESIPNIDTDEKIVSLEFTTPMNRRQKGGPRKGAMVPLKRAMPPISAKDGLAASSFGLGSFLLAGSLSSPIALPLSKFMGFDKDDEWVSDRRDGFASLPPGGFVVVLAILSLLCGCVVERGVMLFGEGDVNLTLQLGILSVLWGMFIEFGRFVVGEKSITRSESERADKLADEFNIFANDKIVLCSETRSVHGSEVLKAFRRFSSRYRTAEQISDGEVLDVFYKWLRKNRRKASSAGFVKGIELTVLDIY